MAFSIVSSDNGSTISVFEDGKVFVADSSHVNYEAIVAGAVANEKVAHLFNIAKTVTDKFSKLTDRVSLKGGSIYFDNEVVENALTEQVLDFMQKGLEFMPLVKFWEKLAQNEKKHSRKQLFRWLDKNNVQITSDGDLLMYKGVNTVSEGLWSSINAGPTIVNGEDQNGHILQKVGDIVEMPRGSVNHDPSIGCSTGLHAATFEYAKGFSRGAVLTLKVNPRDIVSVPTDCYDAKVRTCRYEVMGFTEIELEGSLIIAYDVDDEDDFYYEDASFEVGSEVYVKGEGNSTEELSKRAKKQKRDKKGHFCKC